MGSRQYEDLSQTTDLQNTAKLLLVFRGTGSNEGVSIDSFTLLTIL